MVSNEDVTIEGYRVALRHKEDLIARLRRYTHALSDDLDPVRRGVATELIEGFLGEPCSSCTAPCVNGPVCEVCLAQQELSRIQTAVVQR